MFRSSTPNLSGIVGDPRPSPGSQPRENARPDESFRSLAPADHPEPAPPDAGPLLYLPRELISFSPYRYGPKSSEYQPGVQPATNRLMVLLAEGRPEVAHWVYVNHAEYGPVLLPSTGDNCQGCTTWYPPSGIRL